MTPDALAALAMFLHPAQLEAAKAAGYVRDEPDGTMTLTCPYLDRAQVFVTEPMPTGRRAK